MSFGGTQDISININRQPE